VGVASEGSAQDAPRAEAACASEQRSPYPIWSASSIAPDGSPNPIGFVGTAGEAQAKSSATRRRAEGSALAARLRAEGPTVFGATAPTRPERSQPRARAAGAARCRHVWTRHRGRAGAGAGAARPSSMGGPRRPRGVESPRDGSAAWTGLAMVPPSTAPRSGRERAATWALDLTPQIRRAQRDRRAIGRGERGQRLVQLSAFRSTTSARRGAPRLCAERALADPIGQPREHRAP
jgi:hypothetical protein